MRLGTEILMNDNTWKRVETLEIGDVVKSGEFLLYLMVMSMVCMKQGTQENIDNITMELN